MSRVSSFRSGRRTLVLAAMVVSTVIVIAACGAAQQTGANQEKQAAPAGKSGHDEMSLVHQLHELQSKVAKLEAALQQNHQAAGSSSQNMNMGSMNSGSGMSGMKMGGMSGGQMGMGGMSGMGMMDGRGMMSGMMGQGMSGIMGGGMGGMSEQGMSGMGMGGMSGMGMMGGKGMSMMGQIQGMGEMQMPSALPGFAGASHIYHIGATSFFLDHPQHISLTTEQQAQLNGIKEKALLGQATFDRWISEGEQELWVLTSSDAPKAAEIEAKIRQIEKLRGDKQIAYIRAVGEAAQALTDEQRKALVGHLPPQHTASGGTAQNREMEDSKNGR